MECKPCADIRAGLGKGCFPTPVASPGTRAFRPWTLTKGAFVLPVEPKTADSQRLRPKGLRAPWNPDQGGFRAALGALHGGCGRAVQPRDVPSLDPEQDGFAPAPRPKGLRALWNPDRGFGPGDDQGCMPLEPASIVLDPPRAMPLGTA